MTEVGHPAPAGLRAFEAIVEGAVRRGVSGVAPPPVPETLPPPLDGTQLGRCMWPDCPLGGLIARKTDGHGEGIGYLACSNDCGRLCVHQECLSAMVWKLKDRAPSLLRCDECEGAFSVQPERRALGAIVMGAWDLTRRAARTWAWATAASVLLYVAWFALLYLGYCAVDLKHNALVRDRGGSLSVFDFNRYNFTIDGPFSGWRRTASVQWRPPLLDLLLWPRPGLSRWRWRSWLLDVPYYAPVIAGWLALLIGLASIRFADWVLSFAGLGFVAPVRRRWDGLRSAPRVSRIAAGRRRRR